MTAVEDIGTLIVHLATSVMVIVKIGKVATVITVDEGTGGVRLAFYKLQDIIVIIQSNAILINVFRPPFWQKKC